MSKPVNKENILESYLRFIAEVSQSLKYSFNARRLAKELDDLIENRYLDKAASMIYDFNNSVPGWNYNITKWIYATFASKKITGIELKITSRISRVEKLESQANRLILEQPSPFQTSNLQEAIKVCQDSLAISNSQKTKLLKRNTENELFKREKFIDLYYQSKRHATELYFSRAVEKLESAQKLYSPEELLLDLESYKEKCTDEDQYKKCMAEIQELLRDGKLDIWLCQFKSASRQQDLAAPLNSLR